MNRIGRYLVNRKSGGSPINKDLRSTVAHGYVTIQIHLHGRDVAKYVLCGTPGIHRVFLYVVYAFVEFDFKVAITTVDNYFLHGATYSELNITQIFLGHSHALARVERKVASVYAITHEVYRKRHAFSHRYILDAEVAIGRRNTSANQRSLCAVFTRSCRLKYLHYGVFHGLLRVSIDNLSIHFTHHSLTGATTLTASFGWLGLCKCAGANNEYQG